MTQTAAQKNYEAYLKLINLTDKAERSDGEYLRRAALTLHRWYEHECNGTIQRDGDNGEGSPYWYSTNTGKRMYKAADRERGAVKRIDSICKRLGLHYYLQTDPRGGTLYVYNKEIPENNYNRAVFIA